MAHCSNHKVSYAPDGTEHSVIVVLEVRVCYVRTL